MYLETERLIIAEFSPADVQDYYDIFRHEEVALYEDFYTTNLADAQTYIDLLVHSYQNDNTSGFDYAVTLKNNSKVIGCIFIQYLENEQCSIGFHFNPQYHHRGYAYESVLKTIDYLFSQIKITKIHANVDINNINSIKLLTKLGFQRLDNIKRFCDTKNIWCEEYPCELTPTTILDKQRVKNSAFHCQAH